MHNVDLFLKYLPVFIPVLIIELVLMLTALIHVLRHPNYRFGNKVVWILVVLFIKRIGPVIYFCLDGGDVE